MRRVERGQVISPKTELRYGHNPEGKNPPESHIRVADCGKKYDQGNQKQSGNLKNVQEPFSAEHAHGKNGHQDAADEPSQFLGPLQEADNLLLVGVGQISDFGATG